MQIQYVSGDRFGIHISLNLRVDLAMNWMEWLERLMLPIKFIEKSASFVIVDWNFNGTFADTFNIAT